MSKDILLELYNCYKSNKIDNYKLAEIILYDLSREIRFKAFLVLYYATLNENLDLTFKVFREAYCASDNIFRQIQEYNKDYETKFHLKTFLRSLKDKGVDFINLLSPEEKEEYNKLPDKFKLYRGMNNDEYESNDYGISWSLEKKEAEKYVYFDKNNVSQGKGGVLEAEIQKKDVLAVFLVHGMIEIICID